MISKEMDICKFLLVNPATCAIKALSMARRVKWFRANLINQQTFYHVAILKTYKISTDRICLIDLAIEVAETKSVY